MKFVLYYQNHSGKWIIIYTYANIYDFWLPNHLNCNECIYMVIENEELI